MYSEINKKMEQAKQGILTLNKIDAMLIQLKKDSIELNKKAAQLKSIYEKENLDEQKLNKFSMLTAFYTMLGTLQEHRKKEQAEALVAKLKYNQALKDLQYIEKQIVILSSKRMIYKDSPRLYEELYKLKKQQIVEENSDNGLRVLALSDQINHSKGRIKELNESLKAGKETLESIQKVMTHVLRAADIGLFDVLGGGFFANISKYNTIEAANNELENAHNLMLEFRKELADVTLDKIDIEIGGFTMFLDIFIDGLLTDLFAQSKIYETRDNVKKAESDVKAIIEKLEYDLETEIQKVDIFEKEMNELIAAA